MREPPGFTRHDSRNWPTFLFRAGSDQVFRRLCGLWLLQCLAAIDAVPVMISPSEISMGDGQFRAEGVFVAFFDNALLKGRDIDLASII
ncbi:hypothetical protein AAE478_004922 [Parahypoxylon ruwenzoriense]